MGKIKHDSNNITFSPLQKFIFDEFSKNSKLVKLELKELKHFYTELARKIGSRVIRK